ncbi:MAG: hypothetical protein RLZZ01_2552, partial [Actinomycetota bacterium]
MSGPISVTPPPDGFRPMCSMVRRRGPSCGLSDGGGAIGIGRRTRAASTNEVPVVTSQLNSHR